MKTSFPSISKRPGLCLLSQAALVGGSRAASRVLGGAASVTWPVVAKAGRLALLSLAVATSCLAEDFYVKPEVVLGNWSNAANWANLEDLGLDELGDPLYGPPQGSATTNIIFNPASGAPVFTLDDANRAVNNITFASTTTGQIINTNVGETFKTLTLHGNVTNPGNRGVTLALPITLTTGTHEFDANGDTIAVAGPLQGTGGLTVDAAAPDLGLIKGRVILGVANTFAGTTNLTSGILQLSNFNSLQNSTLETGSTGVRRLDLVPTGLALNSSSFNLGGLSGNLNISITNAVTDGTGGSGFRSLSVGANGQSTTYGGILSGTGRLYKVGSGLLNLTGANTYTGSTVVSVGELAVNGRTSTTGVVSVASGATLSGSGTVGGNTTLTTGATHAPGNSPGLQTFDSNLTYNTGSIFEWELTSKVSTQSGGLLSGEGTVTAGTGVRGTDFDAVNVTGSTTVTSGAIFKIVLGEAFDRVGSAFWDTRQVWSVFNTTGTKTGTFDTFQIWENGGANQLTANSVKPGFFSFGWGTDSLGANSGNLIWTPIPEPGNALVGLILGAGLLKRRRKLVTA